MNTEDRVKKIIAKELGRDVAFLRTEDRLIDDLGAESLDGIEIAMSLEEEFGIEITDEELGEFKTVGDVVGYVEGRVGKG